GNGGPGSGRTGSDVTSARKATRGAAGGRTCRADRGTGGDGGAGTNRAAPPDASAGDVDDVVAARHLGAAPTIGCRRESDPEPAAGRVLVGGAGAPRAGRSCCHQRVSGDWARSGSRRGLVRAGQGLARSLAGGLRRTSLAPLRALRGGPAHRRTLG